MDIDKKKKDYIQGCTKKLSDLRLSASSLFLLLLMHSASMYYIAVAQI